MNILKQLPPKAKKGEMVAMDTEFFGQSVKKLHRPHGVFACITVVLERDLDTAYIIQDWKELKALVKLVKDGMWTFHNAMYDLTQLRPLVELELDDRFIWDTMLVEQSMQGGYYRNFSLKDLARRYLGIVLQKEARDEFEGSSHMTEEMIRYAAKDSIITAKIALQQMDKFKDGPGWKAYLTDQRMMWPLLEINGVRVDADAWQKSVKEFTDKATQLQDKLGINVNSSAQVIKYLNSNGLHVQNTQAKTLLNYADRPDVQAILETRMYRKAVSTYGTKWLENHVELDGRVYSSLHITGAECMPAGELVLTDRGYIEVEKVEVGDHVISHTGRQRKVTKTVLNGIKTIYEVTTSNGLKLRTTGNHPYLTSTGWETAKMLTPGTLLTVHSDEEEWRRVEDWEDFSVSSWGRVRNDKTGRIVTQYQKGKWGHLKVLLFRNGAQVRGEDRKDFPVHRLVANAFFGKKDGLEIRHLNGIAWDNTLRNLAWGTHKENFADAMKHGTLSKQGKIKLTLEQVTKIRTHPKTDKEYAKEFGVSRETVRDIRNRKRWTSIEEAKEKLATFYEVEVVSVEVKYPQMTYGLTIEEDHSHVTGGIVTHNTGRMSSSSPNLQNIPARKLPVFRTFFIPSPNSVMVVDDVSQQEPCILASESEDPTLIAAIKAGEDLHQAVADAIHMDRSIGKAINLGIGYGLSPHGLSDRVGITEEEATTIITNYFTRFSGVFNWIQKQRSFARNNGYVKTSSTGRRIYVNPYDNQWQNNAINAPIQGGAADFTKVWVRNYWERCRDLNIPYSLCMIVHDEIVMDVPKEYLKTNKVAVNDAFHETSASLFPKVPFRFEMEQGKSWACKQFDEEAYDEEEEEDLL